METLFIVIPAYNEEANIRQVIEDWYPVVEKYHGDQKSRLVIIDDGSKDRTYQIVQEYAAARPLLTPVTKKNGGHGPAVLTGYNYALEHGADYIFQTDSDGQTLPEEFDPFWEQKNDWDMLIGLRKGRQDGFSRIVVTKTLKAVIRLCFGVSAADANTPYRLIRSDVLKKYISLIPQDFFLSNVLLSVIFEKKGCRVKYLPITFRPRQGSVNSINLKRIVKIGIKALRDFRQINRQL